MAETGVVRETEPERGGRAALPGARRVVLSAILALAVWMLESPAANATSPYSGYSDSDLISGFMRTVFGLEHNPDSPQAKIVKKFNAPVLFTIRDQAARRRAPAVAAFIAELPRRIRGLEARLAGAGETANFEVIVVDRADYVTVARSAVFGAHGAVPGNCVVQIRTTSGAIARATAIIVSDDGEFLFRRCLVEEILQGLGPLNDDDGLNHSVFNDRSRIDYFGVFDEAILNMLYDPRVRAGMNRDRVLAVLPEVLRELRGGGD